MPELLERDQALRQLDTTLKLVGLGTGRVVLVPGEAGIGKTSLVERFTDQHRREARVLWGACEALFTPRPLGPLYDIAPQLSSDLLSLLESNAPRPRIFGGLLTELKPGRQPSIVVIEDVHWADEATLDLIKYLGRRITRTSTLLILTYRDDEVGPHHPMRLLLGDLPSATLTRVPLAPLSEVAVETLARQANRPAAGVHAVTGGNPFFVTEVLASDAPGVPATVRDAVLARAARLSPPARRIVEAAAVIGARTELWLLEAVAGRDAQAAAEAIAAGLLRPFESGVGFRHELARQAVLETVPPATGRTLHKAVLEALRSSPLAREDFDRLAHHAEAAGDAQAVVEYAPEAGRRAVALGSHREAAAQYARALRFSASLPPRDRAPLLEAYAEQCWLTDRMRDAIEADTEAARIWRNIGERAKEAQALVRLAQVFVRDGRNADAEQASLAALEILEPLGPSRALAAAYRTRAMLLMMDRQNLEAVGWGEKAIPLAERFAAVETQIMAYNFVGSALILSGKNEDGRRYLEQSLHLAHEADLPNLVAWAYWNLGSASGEVYDFETAERYLTEGMRYCVDRDLDTAHAYMQAWTALVEAFTGRWDRAVETARAVASRPQTAATSKIMALIALGRVYVRRGDAEGRAVLDEALALALPTGTLQRLAPVRAARAEAAWLNGDHDATASEARAAYDLALRRAHPWFIGELAYWRSVAGDLQTTPDEAAIPFALQMRGEWATAAAEWERLGCPYERARALADGDPEAGRTALMIFDQLGARPAAELVRRNLRARGVRNVPRGPRASTRSNPAGLSARELEVLSLLADGLQNAEIASRLVLSLKTVDHHVSAILAKLGARSRAEAVAAAYRLAILSHS